MKRHNLAFVDVETTGLNPGKHELIELGLVLVRQVPKEGKGPDLEIIEEIDWKIIPTRLEDADPQSLVINGYTPEKWLFAFDLKKVMEQFAEKTRGASMVAHNVPFDLGFLEKAFEKSGVSNTMHYHRIDTISLALAKLYDVPEVEKFSLRALCEHFGIENKTAHTALSDARATFELFKKLLGR